MKIALGDNNCLSPTLTILCGANVNGKPNYNTIAWVGIMDFALISLAMDRTRYTNPGIKENGTFSVNIPTCDMIVETDYCGFVSGKKVDKGALFETFYGKLKTAPMIRQCPVNMECELVRTFDDLSRHDVFVGKIVETYCDEEYLTGGKVDFARLQPILFVTDGSYWKLGERFGNLGDYWKQFRKEV